VQQSDILKDVYHPEDKFIFDNSRESADQTSRRIARQILLGAYVPFHVEAIERCDILVIIMDGRSIDEDASFELGYALALAKVCVGLKTDSRTLLSFGDNPMIEVALRHICRDEQELLDWLRTNSFS
jgi:nucleoside 2-deoxyribosyltransferase